MFMENKMLPIFETYEFIYFNLIFKINKNEKQDLSYINQNIEQES